MTKTEERALEAYPNIKSALFPFTPLDLNAYRREAFINGYETAEKDLVLTWEDIALIDDLLCEVPSMSKKKYYIEVLERFKEAKK